MDLKNIKQLLFDLGGVIIDLNVEATFEGLSAASGIAVGELKPLMYSSSVFTAFERGDISAADFRAAVKKQLAINISDAELDEIWNRMLVGIPLERLSLLKSLRQDFGLYVLSNTNEIHVEAFNKILFNVSGEKSLESYFDKVHFSHDLNSRKPETEIYEKVLQLNNLKPSEVLFLDDRTENLISAAKLGIQVYEVTSPEILFTLFNRWTTVETNY